MLPAAGSEGTGPAAARLSLARWAGRQMQEHPVVSGVGVCAAALLLTSLCLPFCGGFSMGGSTSC